MHKRLLPKLNMKIIGVIMALAWPTMLEQLMQTGTASREEFAAAGKAYADAQTALDENELVQQMREAQEKYNDLMGNVNRILRLVVTGETEDEGGCSGNCAGCAGCH